MTNEVTTQDNAFPEVGKQYTFREQAVTVTDVKKRGRGYQVYYEGPGDFLSPVRFKDWQAGAQAA